MVKTPERKRRKCQKLGETRVREEWHLELIAIHPSVGSFQRAEASNLRFFAVGP